MLELTLNITACCIWSVISSISTLNWWSSSLCLSCHVPLKSDHWDWDCKLRSKDTPNATGCNMSGMGHLCAMTHLCVWQDPWIVYSSDCWTLQILPYGRNSRQMNYKNKVYMGFRHPVALDFIRKMHHTNETSPHTLKNALHAIHSCQFLSAIAHFAKRVCHERNQTIHTTHSRVWWDCCIYICTFIYIYTYMHTNIHIYIYSCDWMHMHDGVLVLSRSKLTRKSTFWN